MHYFSDEEKEEQERDESLKKIHKVIYFDVLRTQPDCGLVHEEKVQKLLQRVLRIWHIRHPSSGYV